MHCAFPLKITSRIEGNLRDKHSAALEVNLALVYLFQQDRTEQTISQLLATL